MCQRQGKPNRNKTTKTEQTIAVGQVKSAGAYDLNLELFAVKTEEKNANNKPFAIQRDIDRKSIYLYISTVFLHTNSAFVAAIQEDEWQTA